ncbi:hypothetical protein [Fictibacillus macauensis]|nr:hypothetical protein [Fictibacillus macauensis]
MLFVVFILLGGEYDVTAGEKMNSKSSKMAFTVMYATGKSYKLF